MKKAGFTLVELLVVIAIIAILAGILLPALGKILERGKLINDESNLHQITIALGAYQNDNGGRMPPDIGGQSFIVSQQGGNQILLTYTGMSFGVWHSRFDPRKSTEGDGYPISYSLNGKLLTPNTPPNTPGAWNGDLGKVLVAPSKLVVASPNFTVTNGDVSWGANTAANVRALPNKGLGMFQTTPTVLPSFYKLIPTLFADNHVEMVPVANYNCTAADSATWLEWDPLVPNP